MSQIPDAPVWMQVLFALSIFFFGVLPAIGAIAFFVYRRASRLLVKGQQAASLNSIHISKARFWLSLAVRLTAYFLLIMLVSIWTAIPVGIFFAAGTPAVMGEFVNFCTQLVINSLLVSMVTCLVVEVVLRRMDGLPRLCNDLLYAFPGLRLVRVLVLVRMARVVAVTILFLSTLKVWERL